MPQKSAQIDKLDAKIVSLLGENGRMSCADIARKIGNITERSVRYRINRLVDQGIMRIMPVINPASLGLVVIADVFIETEPGCVRGIAQQLASMDRVTYVATSMGEKDISIQVAARTNAEVHSFVIEVVQSIPGVRKTTTSVVPLILKDVYTWPIPQEVFSSEDS